MFGRLDHLYLTVTDLERSQRFYDEVLLGIGWRKVHGRGIPLYISAFGSALLLYPAELKDGVLFDQRRAGLHHLAFHVRNKSAVNGMAEKLREMGAKIVEGPSYYSGNAKKAEVVSEMTFGDGKLSMYSLFFEDPDGLDLEVSTYPVLRTLWALLPNFFGRGGG